MTVLHHAIHIIAGHTVIARLLFLDNAELITIVAVQTVTGGYPYKTIMVLIDLSSETARHLFVGVKVSARLGVHVQVSQKA